jgi:hypothetical protein
MIDRAVLRSGWAPETALVRLSGSLRDDAGDELNDG